MMCLKGTCLKVNGLLRREACGSDGICTRLGGYAGGVSASCVAAPGSTWTFQRGCGAALCKLLASACSWRSCLTSCRRGRGEARQYWAAPWSFGGPLPPPGAVSGTWQWHSQDLGEGGKGDTWLPVMEQLRAVLAGVASLHPPSTLEVADRCYLPILQMMKLKFREDCAVGHTAGQCPSDNCRGSACRRAARWTDCHPG